VLAADGAHSVVRRSLGIGFEGKTYPERYLVLTLGDEVAALLPGLASINYVFDPEAWFVVLRTQDRWRILFPVAPDEPEAVASSPERARQRLREVADGADELRIEHLTLYNVHQRVAERLRVGRIVLAGDAAHVNNPLGGMGMNSGIHDAWLLAGPIAALCRGDGDVAALDECLERRRQICLRHVLEQSDRNARMVAERDPAARRALQDRLRTLAADRGAMREHLLQTSLLAAVGPELTAAGRLPPPG
jgi:3-(3-hydroxy-phenyl)propionate hydroxylase